MKIVTSAEMREIDRKTIEGYGISGATLMERAGMAVAARIESLFGRRRVIVVSGGGNNGGDGLVAARILHSRGWDTVVFLMVSPEDLRGDALIQYRAACEFGVTVRSADALLAESRLVLGRHSLLVDAILGTGLSKPVTGRTAEVVRTMRESGMPIIAVDIPTGVSSDDGQVLGRAVKADYTVTFGLPKRGHFLYPGAEFSGRLFIEDIGFPPALLARGEMDVEVIEKGDATSFIPRRSNYSHKGSYGHVLVVAGSRGKIGSALMAARACLRCGAGLVTLGVPESLADIYQSRVTEEMVLILPDRGDGTLSAKASLRILDFLREGSHVLAIGPGIGVSKDTVGLVKELVSHSPVPMVIDADGINVLAKERKILKKAKARLILTPHPGEMAGLISAGRNEGERKNAIIQEIERNRIDTARSFAGETDTFLVLKGVPTAIATPGGKVFVNPTGNPGMATAGAGDALTGMIAGLLGQIRDLVASCVLGVYMHGLAGDIAASERGQHSMTAVDLIDRVPDAFRSLGSRHATPVE